LCGMTQYSIHPKRSAIRSQAVYFLHSTMPSVTCLRLRNVSVICRITYFQFCNSVCFSSIYRSPGQTSTAAYYWFCYAMLQSNIDENLGRYLVRNVQPRERFILTIKMETRHPTEGQFGSEFPAICNHYRVMMA